MLKNRKVNSLVLLSVLGVLINKINFQVLFLQKQFNLFCHNPEDKNNLK